MNKSIIALAIWLAVGGAPLTVIDGDTLRLNGESVRLKGISAPEMREPGGPESKDHLKALIGDSSVQCDFTGERTHGRQVGWCKSGDLDLNGQMVRDGWAAACPRYSGRYIADETEAKMNRRGIWAIGYELPCYCIQTTKARQECHTRERR